MQLVITTYNAGPDRSTLPPLGHVLTGNEWGDRSDLTAAMHNKGWLANLGSGVDGQSSTPLFHAPILKSRSHIEKSMLTPRYIGPGAGPDRNKWKWAIGDILGTPNGLSIGVVSTHLVASQQERLRLVAAQEHIKHLLTAFNARKIPFFIGGDFNCVPDDPQLMPMYKAGWTNNHRALGRIATHGNRAIDYVWWKPNSRVKPVKQWTNHTGSDHLALSVQFEIK
jgi:hypothetical protein